MSFQPHTTLRRTLGLAAALALLLGVAFGPQAAPRPNQPQPLENHYSRAVGEPFFLLSDATYGSQEAARVRVEVQSPEALREAGGLDVVVYRVPEPLAFLQKQRNLHRVQFEGRPAEEGLANALTHIWDSWSVKARLSWRQLFSPEARVAVTAQAPALKTHPKLTQPSTFGQAPQFKPLPGLTVVERFRYPLPWAKPIQPPKDLKLPGSSSGFTPVAAGNVHVPLGVRAPGLYVVEAVAGQHRATTLLFVSDTVAITKVSAEQMLVWAARRNTGAPVPSTQVVWTDGVGVLQRGLADAQGLVRMARQAPEQTYLFGADPSGGVFISENFYYDSEIYAAKVYATTDRPLYRPGDTVQFKLTGREFKNARESLPLKDADVALTVLDPAGLMVHTQTVRFSGATGGDGRFALPDNAIAGGYELRFAFGTDSYTAAFRVADYQKPHFEIMVLPDKTDFATGQAVTGQLQLNYPDGKPVAQARISLTARAQALTMVDGELDYAGAFPLKLSQEELSTNAQGVAKFSLPAADKPSRYLLSALATDGAAYRVRGSKELLIERASTAYSLRGAQQFSKPGEAVSFRFAPSTRNLSSAPDAQPVAPTAWEWLRLEDRSSAKGRLSEPATLALSFPKPGSYTVQLRDTAGRVVAATSHWVSGDGARAPTGTVEMVFNRASYQPGDTAELLVSFPEPIDQALLTLERERVEATALLGQPADWVQSQRLSPTQWKLSLPVREAMSPNVTVSVVYVKDGQHVFQNQGLLVQQPRVALALRTDKPVYQPGETVTLDLSTTLAGKPVAAQVALGVVDEMIYVLQPEIAPSIEDFYFHPRRNNVRTSASLSFIGYDLATSQLGQLPSRRQVGERAIKVLERPRRDNTDTATWQPALQTDASGRARISFTMPDSLTRWRVTARAITADGSVGQQTAWLRSNKPFYAKWTSPTWQRDGDKPQASVALFNQTGQEASVQWSATGGGLAAKGEAKLRPGINFVTLPTAVDKAEGVRQGNVTFSLLSQGKVVDQLSTPLQRLPVAWRAAREQLLELNATGPTPLGLPPDATSVRLSLGADPAGARFSRWMDSLIDYPYGCVEQTASRLLPLSLALRSLSPAQASLAPALTQRLATARLSLAQMAGPEARFGWWGRGMPDDAFLTTYAYYADWQATQALRTPLPPEHWQRLLDVYANQGNELPPLQRALALHWMQEMGLPVTSMANALVAELSRNAPDAAPTQPRGAPVSLVLHDDDTESRDAALLLALQAAGAPTSAGDGAAARLAASNRPFVQALLMATRRSPPDKATTLLAQASTEAPTIDRAQTLVWLHRALGGRRPDSANPDANLPAPWRRSTSASGQVQWQWPSGLALPSQLPAVAAPGGRAVQAYLSFESRAAEGPSTLPLQIDRRLFKVVVEAPAAAATGNTAAPSPGNGRTRVRLEPVKPGTPLDTSALYLDQITLQGAPQPLRFVLAEVPLPPGATVEGSTWGLDVAEAGAAGGSTQALERARHQATDFGYAVPFDTVGREPLVARHLVRFAQRGVFQLPPTRAHRMYDPDAKAHDKSGQWATVDVR